MANASVDGLVSGLDTTALISQLMQLERQPQVRLTQRKTAHQTAISAYQSINTRLDALRKAADALTVASNWAARSVTSSSTSVTASVQSGATTGSLTFDVAAVAKAAAYVYGTGVSSAQTRVTDQASISITKGTADPVTINVGDGSLASVVDAINASNSGVRATAVQVSPTELRLQLSSTTTGLASDFSVSGLTVGGSPVLGAPALLQAGADAEIVVGPGSAGEYTITSASNTVTALSGVSLTLKEPVNGVTVTVDADQGAVADKVAAMVNAANATLDEIARLTAYDVDAGAGAPLVGDATMRNLRQQILEQVSAATGGSLSTVGIQLERTGKLAFDRTKFLGALTSDPTGTAGRFRATGTGSDSRVEFQSALDRLGGGSWDVHITRAATQASATVTLGAIDGSEELTLTVGSKVATVAALVGDTPQAFADRINDRSATDGLGLLAAVEGGQVVVRSLAYGSGSTFSLASSGAELTASATTAGKDVAGTIDGRVATGSGQLLSATGETNPVRGLVLRVTATEAELTAAGGSLALGTFEYTPGIAQRYDTLGYRMIDSIDGALTRAVDGRKRTITDIDQQVESMEQRLKVREATLRRQFTALETALGSLRDQSTWLAGQLNGLPSWNQSS